MSRKKPGRCQKPDRCRCPKCDSHVNGRRCEATTYDLHMLTRRFLSLLDERGRRLFAGLLLASHVAATREDGDNEDAKKAKATKALDLTAQITHLTSRTITKGRHELEAGGQRRLGEKTEHFGPSRRKGGGRPPRKPPDDNRDLCS